VKWLRDQKQQLPMMTAVWKKVVQSTRREEGQSLVVVALGLTVLMGFLAFATDMGVLLRQRRIAQTVADSAAMAGAFEALYEGTPSSVSTGMWDAAYHDATLNGFVPGSGNGVLNSSSGVTLTLNVGSNISVSGYNSPGNVQAIVTLNATPVFMSFFGFHPTTVGATAIASDEINSNGCIYVLDDGGYDATDTVDMGGNSLITAPNCGMVVNGVISTQGSASISAKFVAETSSAPSGSGWTGNIPPQSDPLAVLQQTANQPTVPSGTKAGGACTAPANSGMSCIYDYNNGDLSGTLQSNTIYYFDSAVNGGNGPSVTGSVTGSNVTLYFAGNIPFDFSNNGAVTLTPPGYGKDCTLSTNPLCGIMIDAPTDGSGGNGTYTCSHGKGNNQGNPAEIYLDFGSSKTDFEGVIYAPYMQLFGQDKGSSTTFASDLIVGNICMQSATFTVDGYSGPQSPLSKIGLVF
jgi:hypothetical protein